MKISYLIRAAHGRSVLCEYQGNGFTLTVYLMHNRPCSKEYGLFSLISYLKPRSGGHELATDIEGIAGVTFNQALSQIVSK